MKRILHISKYYYPFSGGTEQVARDCVLALKGKYEQKVIAFNDGKQDRVEKIDEIDVYKCGCFIKIFAQSLSINYKKVLKKLIGEFKPDIVIFHYPNPFVASLLLHELKYSTAKLIVYWHLDIIRQKVLKNFFINQNRRLLRKAEKIIATSPNYVEGSKWLQSVKEKCIVIPNCINIERMKITTEIKKRSEKIREDHSKSTICVAIGRHTKYKGFTYLIQASKYLDDNFIIFIIGEGELTEQLRREAAEDKKIIFTGRLNDNEMKALLLASDIFCFPSITKNEAFGLVLVEAMYYAKPVVLFSIPGSGVNYVCLNNQTGIEIPNGDAEAYAEAMKKLADNPELRKKMGGNGKVRVEENFLDVQFKENICKVIDDLCVGGGMA